MCERDVMMIPSHTYPGIDFEDKGETSSNPADS